MPEVFPPEPHTKGSSRALQAPSRPATLFDHLSGSLLPHQFYTPGSTVNPDFHFIFSHYLNGLEADNVVMWARANEQSGQKVHLWHDSNLPAYQALSDYFYYRSEQDAITNYLNGEIVLADTDGYLLKLFNHFIKEADREVSRLVNNHDLTLGEAVKEYLSSNRRDSAHRQWLDERVTQLEREGLEQSGAFLSLETQLRQEGFTVVDQKLQDIHKLI